MKKIVLVITLLSCVLFFYNQSASTFDKNLRVKYLLDKVATTPVRAQIAKLYFLNEVVQVCEINGVDTINGFGTTSECLYNFKTSVGVFCLNKLNTFEGKVYDSKDDLNNDFRTFLFCSMDELGGNHRVDKRLLPSIKRWFGI